MSEAHEGNVLATNRSLRLAMIPLLLILAVSTALETTRGEVCVLGSVSAYFHTPVRGAFVAGLAGLGACLITYKGNDRLETYCSTSRGSWPSWSHLSRQQSTRSAAPNTQTSSQMPTPRTLCATTY